MSKRSSKTFRTPEQIAAQRRATAVRKVNGNRRAANAAGIIDANRSYTIPAFLAVMGTTRTGLSAMRRRGLLTRRNGDGRVEILGSEYLDCLKKQPVAKLDDDEEMGGKTHAVCESVNDDSPPGICVDRRTLVSLLEALVIEQVASAMGQHPVAPTRRTKRSKSSDR